MWYSIVAVGPSGLLHSMRFPVELNTGSSEFSGFVAENYGGSSELKRTMMAGAADVLTVKGNNKLYLVEDWLNLMGWDKVYHRPRRPPPPPPPPKPRPPPQPPPPPPPSPPTTTTTTTGTTTGTTAQPTTTITTGLVPEALLARLHP
jgi:hypothetical protein